MKKGLILLISILSFALGHLTNMVVGNVLEDNTNVYCLQNDGSFEKLKKQQEKVLAYGKNDDFRNLTFFIYAKYEFSYKEKMLYNIIFANKWKKQNGFISTSSNLEYLLDNENASFYTKQTLYDILVDFMIRGGLLGFQSSKNRLHELKEKGADYYKNFVADSLSEYVSYPHWRNGNEK